MEKYKMIYEQARYKAVVYSTIGACVVMVFGACLFKYYKDVKEKQKELNVLENKLQSNIKTIESRF